MGLLRPDFTWGWKALVVTGIIALFGGFVVLVCAEFSPSVGFQGVVDYGIRAAGLVSMGVGVLCFMPVVVRDPWLCRPCTEERRRARRLDVAQEAGVVALNLGIYVGVGLLALGALTAIGRAPIPAGIAIVLCLAVLARYRWYRVKHRCSYDYFKPLGTLLLMLVFVAAAGAIGGMQAFDAVADATEGPREEMCKLRGFDERRPLGRYAAFNATDLVIDFTDIYGQHVRVSIKEHDRAALQQILDTGGNAFLTYYPRTGVFVSARSLDIVH